MRARPRHAGLAGRSGDRRAHDARGDGRAGLRPDRRLAAPTTRTSTSSCPGTVFLDIVFTGLLGPPERRPRGVDRRMGSSPGGVANLAVALRPARAAAPRSPPPSAATSTATTAGDCSRSTRASTSRHSRRFEGWHTPVTVSLAFDEDRAMVTHGHPPPELPTTCSATSADARGCCSSSTPAPPRRAPMASGDAVAAGQPGLRRRRLGPTERWDAADAAAQLAGVLRVRAQRRRGDGLHPHRLPAAPLYGAARPGCRSPS